LGVLFGGLAAGCLGGGPDAATPPPEPGDGSPTPTPSGGTPTPGPSGCDPANVDRPQVVEDANHPPQGYGTKPQELTLQSVADYLADFETAYAWNRILVEQRPVTNLGVDTQTPWTPEAAGEGFLASSRIETSYAKQGDQSPTTRTYVASYFVSAGPVYRVETDGETVDPRAHPDRELVQCGTDTK
ncbi:MAG: hypothetical protein R3324_21760, partial [Halobacteriales archaeon]|nr:hypothetical protein [Halobacteriales archaeon]